MKNVLVILTLSSLYIGCIKKDYTVHTTDLDSEWTFRMVGDTLSYPAQVPGTVHTDLLDNGLIDDPYWRNNELNLQWIEYEDWVYTSSFEIDAIEESKNYELEFDGLDTYTSIFLNDSLLGKANNMFREWTFNAKPFLKKGRNLLEVKFSSPITHNKEKFESLGYELPAGSETCAVKVSPFTRKAAYHFGWDWGPRFVTSGIWRPVRLIESSLAKIDHVNVFTTQVSDTEWHVQYSIEYTLNDDDITLSINDHQMKAMAEVMHYMDTIKDPILWNPNGSGDPHLYESTITLSKKGVILEERNVKFGLRTVELINEPDSIGTSYFFKINGEPLFMKGANYIPQDLFLPRVSDSQYRTLLVTVKEAGMNMLRVWGGGIYENDIFYDLCDSLGILVWQDFMFAGSMYPGDEEFVKNIKEEVRQNIRRLQNHPCMALWCGNNEIEVAWYNWGWQDKFGYSAEDSTKIWNEYVYLFQELIPSLVKKYCDLAYVSTSPLSNWGSPENFNYSSMHYWGVWHGKDDFEAFENNVGRFMVEYGFQSYPCQETLRKYTLEEDWSLDSDVLKTRQKSYIGNSEIERMIEKYFHKPRDFEEFVTLSQECQALAMEMAITAHMNSNGHCMGTLFWQLNDCWPGPSWSVIDYEGNKKPAYFKVRELYSPLN